MADQEEPPELGRLPDGNFLWRASLWGGAAIVALASAILITQTDIGSQRLRQVFGAEPPPARTVTQADFVAQPDPEIAKNAPVAWPKAEEAPEDSKPAAKPRRKAGAK